MPINNNVIPALTNHAPTHDIGGGDEISLTSVKNPMDVVGGRLDYVSTTSIKWSFLTSNQIRLFDGTQWRVVSCSSEPTLAYNAHVMGDASSDTLEVLIIYDVWAEYSSATAFTLKCSKWATSTAGASSRVAAWSTTPTEYNVGDKVTESGNTYVCLVYHEPGTFATDLAAGKWSAMTGVATTGDFTGLYQYDGVWVYDNSATGKQRRWLGVIMLDTGPVFASGSTKQYISNYYNESTKNVLSYNSASSWNSPNDSTLAEFSSGGTQYKGYFVLATSRLSPITINQLAQQPAAYGNAYIAASLNSTATNTVQWIPTRINSALSDGSKSKLVSLSAGYNYITQAIYSPVVMLMYSSNGAASSAVVEY